MCDPFAMCGVIYQFHADAFSPGWVQRTEQMIAILQACSPVQVAPKPKSPVEIVQGKPKVENPALFFSAFRADRREEDPALFLSAFTT